MKTFDELRRLAKRPSPEFRRVRLAVLADSAVQLYALALRGEAADRRLSLAVLEGEFDQIDQAILDPSSELRRSRPEFVVVWRSAERLLSAFRALPSTERASFADRHVAHVRRLADALAESTSARIIHVNVPEIDDGVFGSFANKIPSSWVHQLRRINVLLMELASSRDDFFVLDLALLFAEHGRAAAEDRRLAATARMALGVDFLPVVAGRTLDVVDAILGRARKCLVLDLDNTLWGGIAAEDGLPGIELGELGLGPAFTEIQCWAKELERRGVVLAVSSKNEERVAREVFDRHPDMVLRLEDIAVFCAGWESKVDHLRHIQSVIGIGFDGMVFLDDSAVERAAVRAALPEVCVPELPVDPVEVMPFLRRLNLFEAASFTGEDARRTAYYREESQRRALQGSSGAPEDFLRGLEMMAKVEGFTPFNLPRVAQLTQRSNQFNLRSVRHAEGELRRISGSAGHLPFAFSLEDRFGAYGLVSVVILEARGEAMFVDTWLMSCRVLKRGLEIFVLDVLVEAARGRGARGIVGEHLPTPKNALVRDHYATLGFERRGDLWYLDLETYRPREHFIRRA
ncbi:HAD-IIIC family phosphatase [Sorangium sp. So ce128]|uniref:HAD-IIIC family phosphatase n=1 Tax=Sorangium sp. So ce128 TaxID=3133281 RepID=UPI003F632307